MKLNRLFASAFVAAIFFAGCSGNKITLDLAFGQREGTYTGDLKDNIPDGQGKFVTQNENGDTWTYEGTFKNGHFEGEGETTWADGSKEIGTYKNDEIVPLEGDELADLTSDPEKFIDHVVTLKGRIFTTPTLVNNQYFVQIFPIIDDKENDDDPCWLYMDTKDFDLKENDYVSITGKVLGQGSGTNSFGGEVIAPEIAVTKYSKISYADALAPALSTKETNLKLEQSGYSLTLEKIEFAKDETRFYLKAENNGSATVRLGVYNAKVVQDGQQFDTSQNYNADYPQLSYEIIPGASSSGVLVFPELKDEALKLVIEAFSEDYTEEISSFTFDIQ